MFDETRYYKQLPYAFLFVGNYKFYKTLAKKKELTIRHSFVILVHTHTHTVFVHSGSFHMMWPKVTKHMFLKVITVFVDFENSMLHSKLLCFKVHLMLLELE